MRKTFCILLLTLCTLAVSAQTTKVKKWEGGAYCGLTLPFGAYYGGDPKLSIVMGVDVRHNINGGPWDCGMSIELGGASRDYLKDGGNYYQTNRTAAVELTGHYNFRQGEKVNPYVGLGLGYGMHDVVNLRRYISETNVNSFTISPCAGVELLRHIRVGIHSQLSLAGFHYVGTTVGFAIGGGKKKE